MFVGNFAPALAACRGWNCAHRLSGPGPPGVPKAPWQRALQRACGTSPQFRPVRC